jgi:predicted dehydrogenase
MKKSTRRKFLHQAAMATAGVMIVPRYVLGGPGYTAPSDRLHIALVGAGGKGEDHIRNLKGSQQIVALCDVDDRRASNAYNTLPKAARFRDYRKMLDTMGSEIDAVMITTPDHTHAMITLAAMEAGKHVYVEKPLTHNIAELRQLQDAAVRYPVVTQMGNQGASMDCNAEVAEWIAAGAIGKVHSVHVWTNRPVWPQGVAAPVTGDSIPDGLDWNLWLGPAAPRPFSNAYLPFRWRGWWDFGTGALGDMGCHLMDVPYRALQLGAPSSVEANATTVWSGDFVEANYPQSCPPSSIVKYEFPERGRLPACALWWYDGGVRPMRPAELGPNEPFGTWDGGVLFEGSGGKLICGIYGQHPTLLPTSRMRDFKPPKASLPRYKDSHQMVWVNACKGIGKASSPFEYACPLTEMLLIGNLAVRCYDLKVLQPGKTATSWAPYDYPGRVRLEWDPAGMRVKNLELANRFIGRGDQ